MGFMIVLLRSCIQVLCCAVVMLVLVISKGKAQQMVPDEPPLPAFYQQHEAYLSDAKTGMYVLSGWGLASATGSAYAWSQQKATGNDQKTFWQYNAAWGAVNLGIGLIGLYRTNKQVKALERQRDVYLPDSVRAAALAEAYRSHKRAFGYALISDVILAGLGAAATSYGPRDNRTVGDNQVSQVGYAMLYQSIGLGIFDGFMYLHTTGEQNKLKPYFSPAPSGIGMVYHF